MDIIYIYKYTNQINGHAYIGKTNNVERRRREHKSNAYNANNSFYHSLWCQKIREYGYENFDFEILEEANINNWAEREKYWINYYNTFNGAGYNSTEGGDKDYEREKKLNDIQVSEIIELLQNSDEAQCVIASEYNISSSLLSNINTGLQYKQENIEYPIRKNYKSFEDYESLINDIVNTTIPFTELCVVYNCGYSTVKKINEGKMHHQNYLSYPLRKQDKHQEKAEIIKFLLKNTELKICEIAAEVNCSRTTVGRINSGATHYDSNEQYPLRKPVSTIPEA